MTSRERLYSTLARIREFAGMRRVRQDVDEELQFHIESEVAYNIQRGLSPDEARRAAMNAFGGMERYRDEVREARGIAFLDALLRDTRLAFRRLRRAPTYATGVVATLAVALGASTAIGALVYGVMLRPLPYADANRIVRISVYTPGLGISGSEQSAGTFVFFKERAKSFAQLGGSMENEGVAITDGETPERVTAAMMTPDVLGILGAKPIIGRLFRDEDARLPNVPVLISHELWMRRFGGASDIAGKTIEINRRPREILGVMPAEFGYPSRNAAVFLPDYVEAEKAGLAERYLTVIAKLAPGVTVAQAQEEVDRLSAQLRERFPELPVSILTDSRFSARVETLRDAIAAPIRPELLLLGIMVGALLLIAMANTATLALLRASRLQGEVAVSRALGAGRGTIVQRFVVEGIIIAVAGGLLALLIATATINAQFGLTGAQIPRLHEITMTPGVALGLIVITVVAGAILGLVTSARADGIRRNVALSMRSTTRTTHGRAWRRTQEGLVTLQIALALSLLLAAGLMGSSLIRLNRVNPGFSPAGNSRFTVHLPFRPYPTYQRTAAFHLGVLDALRALPGVTSAGAAMQFPSTPQSLYSHPRLEARDSQGQVRQTLVNANVASAEFFRTMGIPLVAGRSFEAGDLIAPTPGVIISKSLAQHLFGADDPIGREVKIPTRATLPAYRVIGISGDVYGDRVAEGVLRTIYFPLLNDLPPNSTETEQRIPFMPAGLTYVVKSTQPHASLVPAIRQAVASIDARVPVWDIGTLDALVANSTARTRLTMILLGLAALATLSLGAIGLYSVIAYAVAGRAREFAVRLSIGATPREITAQVLRESVAVSIVGILGGLALSFASARVLRDLVYEVSPTDPLLYAGATVVVLLCTAVATFSPARRAGKINPARALLGE